MIWKLLTASLFTVLASPGIGSSLPEVGQLEVMAAEADSSSISFWIQVVPGQIPIAGKEEERPA